MQRKNVVIATLLSVWATICFVDVYRRRDTWKESLSGIFPFHRRPQTSVCEACAAHTYYKPNVYILVAAAVLRGVLLLALVTLSVLREAWYECAILVALLLLLLMAEYQLRQYYSTTKANTPMVASTKEPAYPVDRRLTGSWVKVDRLSDSMAQSIAVLQLGGVAKQAVKMFKGVEINVDNGFMEMTAFSLIPFLQASTEKYALNGEESFYPRRDLRKGKHTGSATVEPDGSVSMYAHWDPPFGGEAIDEFRLAGANELHVTTALKVGLKSCKYTVVYNRG